MEKRKLYKKYSGVCLSEGEYKNLENTGCIRNNLGNVFHGIWISKSIDKGYLKGAVIDDICSTDAKMFLEDWYAGNDWSGSDHTAAFVFQELFVIVAEPKLNLQHSFDPLPDVLPIAIPLRRIKDVSSEKYVGWYKMNIKFDDGSSYTAITGRFDSYDNAYIYASNFSFNANERLLGGISRDIRNADNNQKQIESSLCNFVKSAKKDFDERSRAIVNLFNDKTIIYELEQYIYGNEGSFVNAFVKNKDKLREGASEELVRVLENTKKDKEENDKQLEALRVKKRELGSKLVENHDARSNAGFFKKRKLEKEGMAIYKEIREIENKEKGLNKTGVDYSYAYRIIIDAATRRSESTLRVSDEEFELAKQVYTLCSQRKVVQLNTEDDYTIFSLICNQLGVPERLRNKEFFNLGAPVEKESVKKKSGLSDELKKKRVLKQVEYGEEKDRSKIVGIEKYIAYAIGRQRNAEFSVKAYDYIANASTPLKPVTHDSAIIGGLVSSLSGPVVGVVAAAKTEASNAAAKASYEEAKANSHQIKATAYDNQNKSLADAKYYGNIVQKIKNKLCDTNNTEKYYEYLNCTVSKYSIEDDGSMSIIIETSFSKEPKIGEMAISIDGSLHILIQKEGELVGDGYLCADGFNNIDLSNVGFKNDRQYSVIGLPMQTEFDAKEKYDIEIEPINIWAIEV